MSCTDQCKKIGSCFSNLTCSLPNLEKINNQCFQKKCTADTMCNDGYSCQNGICNYQCNQDSNCANGFICDKKTFRCVSSSGVEDEDIEEEKNNDQGGQSTPPPVVAAEDYDTQKKYVGYLNNQNPKILGEKLKQFAEDPVTNTLIFTFVTGDSQPKRDPQHKNQPEYETQVLDEKYDLAYTPQIQIWKKFYKDGCEAQDTTCSTFKTNIGQNYNSSEKLMKQLKDKNKKILLSFGGAVGTLDTDDADRSYPSFYKWDDSKIISRCTSLAKMAYDYGFDGVDLDIEQMPGNKEIAVNFATKCGTAIHDFFKGKTDKKRYLTFAPEAPHFELGDSYVKINNQIGDIIDFYNVQFYNQGNYFGDANSKSGYDSESSLFYLTDRSNTSITSLINKGVKSEKIVIGKGASLDCVGTETGMVDFTELGKWTKKFEKENDKNLGGYMLWAYDICPKKGATDGSVVDQDPIGVFQKINTGYNSVN